MIETKKEAKEILGHELFLGFYKKNSLKPFDYQKSEFEILLESISEMEKEDSWGKVEKIYEKNIKIIKEDIETILNNMKIDIKSLKKDDFFYTMENFRSNGVDNYFIKKWQVVDIIIFKNSFSGNKTIYSVVEKDYGYVCVGENNEETQYFINYCFTEEELNLNANQTDEYFKKTIKEYQDNSEEYQKQLKHYKDIYDSFLDN